MGIRLCWFTPGSFCVHWGSVLGPCTTGNSARGHPGNGSRPAGPCIKCSARGFIPCLSWSYPGVAQRCCLMKAICCACRIWWCFVLPRQRWAVPREGCSAACGAGVGQDTGSCLWLAEIAPRLALCALLPLWFPCRGGHKHQSLCHGVLCQLCFGQTQVGLPVLDTQGLGGQIQNTAMSNFNWETFWAVPPSLRALYRAGGDSGQKSREDADSGLALSISSQQRSSFVGVSLPPPVPEGGLRSTVLLIPPGSVFFCYILLSSSAICNPISVFN